MSVRLRFNRPEPEDGVAMPGAERPIVLELIPQIDRIVFLLDLPKAIIELGPRRVIDRGRPEG